jgi:hypothetical protein
MLTILNPQPDDNWAGHEPLGKYLFKTLKESTAKESVNENLVLVRKLLITFLKKT